MELTIRKRKLIGGPLDSHEIELHFEATQFGPYGSIGSGQNRFRLQGMFLWVPNGLPVGSGWYHPAKDGYVWESQAIAS